jgi:hypothetical protein
MFASSLDEFEFSKEVVFEYLILNKDLRDWVPPEKGIYEVKNIFNEGQLKSLEVLCDIDGRRATMWLDVTHYEPCKEVRFYSDKAVFDNGEPLNKARFFPYKYIAFRYTFNDTPEGCNVLQDIYLFPNGFIGWILCKIFVMPPMKRELKASATALKTYLKDRIHN